MVRSINFEIPCSSRFQRDPSTRCESLDFARRSFSASLPTKHRGRSPLDCGSRTVISTIANNTPSIRAAAHPGRRMTPTKTIPIPDKKPPRTAQRKHLAIAVLSPTPHLQPHKLNPTLAVAVLAVRPTSHLANTTMSRCACMCGTASGALGPVPSWTTSVVSSLRRGSPDGPRYGLRYRRPSY